MRVVIKLLIAGLVVHGSWRAGAAYWDYYRFRDAVQELAQFARDSSDGVVQARVLEIASTFQLPLEAERVSVRREGPHTLIDAAYVDQIEILPSYRVPWTFTVNVDAWTGSAPNAGDRAPARP
jgi:hypothetical protein